ncbi:HlyD family efflux transporter periplasmic adaptor subunit [Ruminiclostridium herbifermentans]|uniref:HlyD family efflux transporter periplasmic adaptor subunit n=1 Tax=Ruminiclostridium herbifermentans TaxID=2488810 RepID=UPI001FD1A5C8|nr:HlyD family efflux transporter periplasmic adaptor subunit [Ruminiclostridium herbifermentans]
MGSKKIKWSRKKVIICSIVGAIVIAIAAGGFILAKNNASKSASTTVQRTAKVTRGNIEVSITGSGTITSANTADLMSNVEGKIIKAYFKEGDTVKEGDLLYEIDDNDAQLNIQKIENSISQAMLNASSSEKNYDNLVITAPFSGKVTGVQAEEGESVNNGKSLFTITDTTNLIISVPFSIADIKNIRVGQKVQVNLQEQYDTIDGVITEIDDNTYNSSNGGMVQNVVVRVTNPGTLTDSSTASVSLINSNGTEIVSQDIGKFAYENKKTVQAGISGEFSAVNIKENQYVNKGDVLITINNDDLQITSKTNELKMQDLQNQLAAAKKNLEDYKVYAPFDGTISSVSAEQGDSLQRGAALLSIRDFNQMQFTISVDELDISKVKVGQDVSVTVDALSETLTKPRSGKVIYKAMEGTSSNGVATYDVTIKINETENLLAGMNANARIIIDKAENALLLPIEAVTKIGNRAFVWVKGSSDGDNQQVEPGREGGTPPVNRDASAGKSEGDNKQTEPGKEGRTPPVNRDASADKSEGENQQAEPGREGGTPPVNRDASAGKLEGVNQRTPLVREGRTAPVSRGVSTSTSDGDNKQTQPERIPSVNKDASAGKLEGDNQQAMPEREGKTPPANWDFSAGKTEGANQQTESGKEGRTPPANWDFSAGKTEGANQQAIPRREGRTFPANWDASAGKAGGGNQQAEFGKEGRTPPANRDASAGKSEGENEQVQTGGEGKTPPENMESSANTTENVQKSDNNQGNNGNEQDEFSASNKNIRMPTVFTQNQEYYANATMVFVEVGLASDTYIEIKSGLSEGDEVILPPLAEASNGERGNARTSGGFNMGGMGGMSGRMPTGGMPGMGGGMPGGMPSGGMGSRMPSGGGMTFGGNRNR